MAKRYRARPLGWDEQLTPEQLFDMDPYDGPTDWIEGELSVRQAAVGYPWEYTQYGIGNFSVDPKTLVEIGDE